LDTIACFCIATVVCAGVFVAAILAQTLANAALALVTAGAGIAIVAKADDGEVQAPNADLAKFAGAAVAVVAIFDAAVANSNASVVGHAGVGLRAQVAIVARCAASEVFGDAQAKDSPRLFERIANFGIDDSAIVARNRIQSDRFRFSSCFCATKRKTEAKRSEGGVSVRSSKRCHEPRPPPTRGL